MSAADNTAWEAFRGHCRDVRLPSALSPRECRSNQCRLAPHGEFFMASGYNLCGRFLEFFQQFQMFVGMNGCG
jgi:hypothetical protein